MPYRCNILDIRKPITIFSSNDLEDILISLEHKIKKDVGQMNYKTNVQGQMTNFKQYNHDPDFHKILNIWLNCKAQFKMLHNYIDKINVIDAWANVLNKDDFVHKHDHIDFHFNSVLYFSNTQINIEDKDINVTRGDIVTMFGFMKHHVKKDNYKNRISLAWNWNAIYENAWSENANN